MTTEEQKNKNITPGCITLKRFNLTLYGCGMILEALRVLAENDESLRADAEGLSKEIKEHIESVQREKAVRMRWDEDPDVRGEKR